MPKQFWQKKVLFAGTVLADNMLCAGMFWQTTLSIKQARGPISSGSWTCPGNLHLTDWHTEQLIEAFSHNLTVVAAQINLLSGGFSIHSYLILFIMNEWTDHKYVPILILKYCLKIIWTKTLNKNELIWHFTRPICCHSLL